MRVLIVEDEVFLAEAIRDGLRLEAIASDIAAGELDDKQVGFGLGADDYLTKPFELAELVLRLRALSRRPGWSAPPVVEGAGVVLDYFGREVHRDGRYVHLTRKQLGGPR